MFKGRYGSWGEGMGGWGSKYMGRSLMEAHKFVRIHTCVFIKGVWTEVSWMGGCCCSQKHGLSNDSTHTEIQKWNFVPGMEYPTASYWSTVPERHSKQHRLMPSILVSHPKTPLLKALLTLDAGHSEVSLELTLAQFLLAGLHSTRRCCVGGQGRKGISSLLSRGACLLQYWPTGKVCPPMQ